jgi:hypothetical protein
MSDNKPKRKQASPASFVFMAIFAFLVGLPIWVVLVLLVMAFLIWRNQKTQKALQDIPLPPEDESVFEQSEQPLSIEEQFARAQREIEAHTQSQRQPDFETFEQPPARTPQPVRTRMESPPAFQQRESFQRASTFVPTAVTPYGSWKQGRRGNAFASNLRGRQGLQQAIVAMNVLGMPRSLQPHELDPMHQREVVPKRKN